VILCLRVFFLCVGWVFFEGFFCSWVLGFIRVLLLFGCLMGAFTVLGFGALEGFGVYEGLVGFCFMG
jgi:hypothetical protein